MRASECLVFVVMMLGRAAVAGTDAGDDVAVSILAQDQTSMFNIATVLNSVISNETVPVEIGSIKAVSTRIVDSTFMGSVPREVAQQVPTFVLLHDIEFRSAYEFSSAEQAWILKYDIVRGDMDVLGRMLYLTKNGIPVGTGDHNNACLQRSVGTDECFTKLQTDYTPAQRTTGSTDYFTYADESGIQVKLGDHESELSLQTMEIVIPHETLISDLATSQNSDKNMYTFGVGMVFVRNMASNVVVFDTFDLVQSGTAQLQVSKSTGYSIAKHVSIVVESVADHPNVSFVTIEYMLMQDYQLVDETQGIATSINDVATTKEACEAMQLEVAEAQKNDGCLPGLQLCQVSSLIIDDTQHRWVTYSIPVPKFQPIPVNLRVDSLLQVGWSGDMDKIPVWTTVNFKTRFTPRLLCSSATVLSFNKLQFAHVALYKSAALEEIELHSETHTIVAGGSSVTPSDALLTLVIEPGPSTAATEYFDDNPLQQLWLDDVFMSHARPEYEFLLDGKAVNNKVTSDSASGRAELVLDLDLLDRCPRVVNASVGSQCVTTHDFDTTGAQFRPGDTSTHYVYELMSTASSIHGADLAWLVNVYGSTPDGRSVAGQFLDAVRVKSSNSKAKVYFIWPVYRWPGSAPVGMRDKALLSLAWSISTSTIAPAPAPATQRRLLTTINARTRAMLEHRLAPGGAAGPTPPRVSTPAPPVIHPKTVHKPAPPVLHRHTPAVLHKQLKKTYKLQVMEQEEHAAMMQ